MRPLTKMINETICVVESELTYIRTLRTGRYEGISIALGIGLIALIGFIVRGLFIYYLKFEAPKERPINFLMLNDQVRNHLIDKSPKIGH